MAFLRIFFNFYFGLRFRGQTQLYKSTPSEFQMAIEEALLAENGILDTSLRCDQTTNSEAYPMEIQESTNLYPDQECFSQNQVSCLNSLFLSLFWRGHLTLRRFWLHLYSTMQVIYRSLCLVFFKVNGI